MMTSRLMARETALRTRGSFTVSRASWKCQRCASSAGVSRTLTPGVALSVWTMSGHTRSITWISPARRAAARVESSGMKRTVTFYPRDARLPVSGVGRELDAIAMGPAHEPEGSRTHRLLEERVLARARARRQHAEHRQVRGQRAEGPLRRHRDRVV